MKKIKELWERFRKQAFPTKEERYQQGWNFAKSSLGDSPTEAEVDHFYEGLPIERNDPYDDGITDYCWKINWGRK